MSHDPPLATFQTGTHKENMAEAAAREVVPASVSELIGTGGALVDQTASSELDRAVGLLQGFLSEDRMARMQDVLDERTRSATLVFENPANPNNVRRKTAEKRAEKIHSCDGIICQESLSLRPNVYTGGGGRRVA